MTDLLVLVVLYRCKFDCSPSISSLAGFAHPDIRLRILVWDNSPAPCATPADMENLGKGHVTEVGYEHHPDNVPLSRIYNQVISSRLADGGYLLLLDQDTTIPQDFWSVLCDALAKFPECDLFLPVVRAGNVIVSPAPFFFGWGRHWKKQILGLVSAKGLVAINSGMIISGRYARRDFVGYDERLLFYGTDSDFMLKFAKQRESFVVLPIVLNHDLSFNSANREERLRKFREMRLAISILFSKKGAVRRAMSALVMGAVSAVYAVRYQDIRYLRP